MPANEQAIISNARVTGAVVGHQYAWRAFLRREVLLATLIAAAFILHAAALSVVAEDAFITFRFARNLAQGHGLVWNIGEAPVEGYTNFLWLVLAALVLRLGLVVVPISQVAGVIAGLGTLAYVYRFAARHFRMPPTHALLPVFFLAIAGPFATWAASGMETSLFTLCVVAGCFYCANWFQSGTPADLVRSLMALLLATLTRPEGFLVLGVLFMFGAVLSIGQTGAWQRPLGLTLLIYGLPFLAYFLWRYHYFGYLLPNTFYAKTGGSWYQYLRGAKYAGLFAFHYLLPFVPIMSLLAWEAGGGAARRWLRWRQVRWHLQANAAVYICILISAVYALYIIAVGGDYMAMYRFFVPLLPQLYLLLGLASHHWLRHAGTVHRRGVAAVLLAGAAFFTVLQSTPIETHLYRQPEFMHGTYRGVQTERWFVARYTLLGEFFYGYRRSPNDSLALEPIGVIPYLSELNIHSVHAIVDPYIAHRPPGDQVLGQGFPGHEKMDLLYALSKYPTYFMFSKDLTLAPQPFPQYGGEIDQLLKSRYHLQSVWLQDVRNDEAGYFTFLEFGP